MADVLDRTVIDGLNHNRPFLSALMDHPRWRKGLLSTAFIDEEYPNGFNGIEPDGDLLRRLAGIALDVELKRRARLRRGDGRFSGKARAHRQNWIVVVGSEAIPLKASTIRVRSDWRPGVAVWSGEVDGRELVVQVRPMLGGLRLTYRGVDVMARAMTPRVAALAALMPEKTVARSAKLVRCPMPGLVVAINVVVGQEVRAGESVAIVEAMKMENVLRAEHDAVVAKINVASGDVVAVDAVIIEFE
jgi:propionyl-CoA carboxylase alpha chain